MKLKFVGDSDHYYAGLGPNADVETWWPEEIAARLSCGGWVEDTDAETPIAQPEPVQEPQPEPAPVEEKTSDPAPVQAESEK